MSRQLFFLHTKSFSHCFALYVTTNWDYWTLNGKRVNFNIRNIGNSEYTGFSLIAWIFNFHYAWRKN